MSSTEPDRAVGSPCTTEAPRPRIGLALSGGGFRASIFHLGVIRRLEELGFMQQVSVVSAVSGGSIIAAYYAIKMEEKLRNMSSEQRCEASARLTAHREIAREFLRHVGLNLRSRAFPFAPFYHPWLFIKSLALKAFRSHARSVLIQAEYDRRFYKSYTLDQLPAVQPDRITVDASSPVITGPKLLLNTTSLMTGERKAFTRDANTSFNDLKSSNKNTIRLSEVVGASSGVPVLFPPTSICGELLVDGGVSDNQGIEGLLPTDLRSARDCPFAEGCFPVEVMLISDACGQLELKNDLSIADAVVLGRVNSVLQHQVRNKLLELLAAKYKRNEFEFVLAHLLLNLKDFGLAGENRVPSEFVEPLARIRTDLDQFSIIECEALMYHGYTLIDSLIKHWLTPRTDQHGDGSVLDDPAYALVRSLAERTRDKSFHLATPPLFRANVRRNAEFRERIRGELIAGSQSVFLIRCWRTFGWQWMLLPYLAACAAWLTSAYLLLESDAIVSTAIDGWHKCLDVLPALPDAVSSLVVVQHSLDALKAIVNGFAVLAAGLTLVLLPAYIVIYLLWLTMRPIAALRDRVNYKKWTGVAYSEELDWSAGVNL